MLRERRRAANFKPNRRLDRKSSRGMIYENEELRLRTININAEVERGQSDIRKLRRENEQLRREIWSLRDEYDRLDKILRQNKHQGGGHQGDSTGSSSRQHHHHKDRECCGEGEEECEEEEEDGECCSCNRSGGEEDGEHQCDDCDSGEDDYCDDENCNCAGGDSIQHCDNREAAPTAPPQPLPEPGASSLSPSSGGGSTRHMNGTSTGSNSAKLRENLHVNFDHLSIVSEENLTGSDGSNSVHNHPADADCPNSLTVPHSSLRPASAKDGKDPKAAKYACPSSSSMLIMSLPATPCSPLLTDFQSLVPPLAHFENLNYDDIKPLPQSSSTYKSNFISKAVKSSPPAAAASSSSSAVAAAVLLASPTLDVPSVAPSPEPPDSSASTPPPPPSTSSLPIVASSVSSSDWTWNNKTVSFSTFRPPTASKSQPSLSSALEYPSTVRKGCAREEGEIVPINPMPRHFFSPLKSTRALLLPSTPDLYMHDVLASPSGSSSSLNAIHDPAIVVVEPIYSTVHKSRPSYSLSIRCSPISAIDNPLYVSQISPSTGGGGGSFTNPIAGQMVGSPAEEGYHAATCSPRSPAAFQVGGNLEELLQDIEGMADEVGQIDLSAHEADGYNRLVPAEPPQPGGVSGSPDLTPPLSIPEPMNLLPATLPYLDFKSNTAVITTPKAALANRPGAGGGGMENGGMSSPSTVVTAIVSKPISSTQAVRRKLFGKKNKEPIITNEPDQDRKAVVVPLKITIPAADDKVVGQQNSGGQTKATTTTPVGKGVDGGGGGDGEVESNQKRKSRRVSLSFPGFGGGSGGNKKAVEDEKDTSSLENLAGAVNSQQAKTTSGKQSLHRVSSGADISSISTSIGSPSTPVKGPCHHHRHNSQKKGKGRSGGHSRTSSESQNVYSSPSHGHHHCDPRRNSAMNDAMTTSMSERNSNSLASSRESSSSLSMRSQKSRRISENSHSGKIPWCACWGNGCL